MSEIRVCDFCKNTGVHLCPDVAEPILVSCSHKQCPITDLQFKLAKATAALEEIFKRDVHFELGELARETLAEIQGEKCSE